MKKNIKLLNPVELILKFTIVITWNTCKKCLV